MLKEKQQIERKIKNMEEEVAFLRQEYSDGLWKYAPSHYAREIERLEYAIRQARRKLNDIMAAHKR